MEGEQAEVSENRKEVEDSRIERLDQDVVNKSEQKQILSTQTKIPNQVKDKDTRVKSKNNSLTLGLNGGLNWPLLI